MLFQVRSELLKEAKHSPGLISDLAGLEKYVAQSYDARSFVELLQNADDAGAKKFVVHREESSIFVANDGQMFTEHDLESLCRSAASRKRRGETIGYRGIGFKSVVGLASSVFLFSGELEAIFSRDLTSAELGLPVDRVPLIRIPHPIPSRTPKHVRHIAARLVADGYHTVFAFDDVTADSIEREFESFDKHSVLFLHHIAEVAFQTSDRRQQLTVARQHGANGQMSLAIASSGGEESMEEQWSVFSKDGVSIALSEHTGGDKSENSVQGQRRF